jgi:hypothetical protein
MRINKLTIEFTHSEAEALRELIDGFFKMQKDLGRGEGSRRVTLAQQLLKILPQDEYADLNKAVDLSALNKALDVPLSKSIPENPYMKKG